MRNMTCTSMVIAIAFCTSSAFAGLGDELFKILPDDGEQEDYFGGTIAVSSWVAIIGASLDGDGGSAYLFDISDPLHPIQLAKLIPERGEPHDAFGSAVAISCTTVLVGMGGDDDLGQSSGSAYLYDITDPANPSLITKLHADDGAAGAEFGTAIALSGEPGREIAVVGADGDEEFGEDAGAVYVFDIASGTQIAKIFPQDDSIVRQFGASIAIEDEIAIIGAPNTGDNREFFRSSVSL